MIKIETNSAELLVNEVSHIKADREDANLTKHKHFVCPTFELTLMVGK